MNKKRNGGGAKLQTGYEGFTHYVTYDDSTESEFNRKSPLSSMRGTEK